MQRHRLMRYLAVIGSLLAAHPAAARAQAFGINEIGTCAVSRGFAVTGSPCKDASAVWWNPGAIGAKTGWSFLAGAAVISIDGSFKEDTTFREFEGDVPTLVVPHFFFTYKPASGALSRSGKLSYGFGVYVPYGLTSQWTDSFPGRFLAKKAALATLYVQPTVAYQLTDKWSVGLGPVIGHSSVELIQALDLSEQIASAGPPVVRMNQLGIARHTEFGTAALEGSATAFGGHIGFFGKPRADVTVGIRFLTPLEFAYDDATAEFTQKKTGIVLPPRNALCYPATRPAFCSDSLDTVDMDADILDAQFTQVTGYPAPSLVSQGVTTHITHPAQVQAGIGYSGYQNWLLSVDYAWTGWRRFRELPVRFQGAAAASSRQLIEDYNNTSSLRVGAER